MRFGAMMCGVFAVAALVGCGQGRDTTTDDLVTALEEGTGVTFPVSERDCAVQRLAERLSPEDLAPRDSAQLSAAGEAEVVATFDACFSPASVELYLEENLTGLPASVNEACFRTAVAKTVKLGQLFEGRSAGTFNAATEKALAAATVKCGQK